MGTTIIEPSGAHAGRGIGSRAIHERKRPLCLAETRVRKLGMKACAVSVFIKKA
jgi:hypothetical protein